MTPRPDQRLVQKDGQSLREGEEGAYGGRLRGRQGPEQTEAQNEGQELGQGQVLFITSKNFLAIPLTPI